MSETTVVPGNRFSPITADDHAGSVWIATTLCLVYSALVVLVRAHLRRKLYGLDDYLIVAALAFQLGEVIAVIVGLENGLGRTLLLLSQSDISTVSKTVFVAQIFYIAASCLAKCSTVSLMMRLFNLNGPKSHHAGRTKLHWWICMVMLSGTVIWGIVSIIGLSVDCSVLNFIRIASRSQCPNQVLRWQLITIFDIVIEALMVIVTIIIVLPVQLTFEMKFQVILAFLFRLPLIALAYVRFYYVLEFADSSNTGLAIVPIMVIQQAYLCWTIISATIPNLKSFVRSFGSGFGIGIDMETYNQTYGSRNTPRPGYELGSVGNTLNSHRAESKRDNRSYNDIENEGATLHSRHQLDRTEKAEGSMDSEDSQQHIIRKDVQWNVHYEGQRSSNNVNRINNHPHMI